MILHIFISLSIYVQLNFLLLVFNILLAITIILKLLFLLLWLLLILNYLIFLFRIILIRKITWRFFNYYLLLIICSVSILGWVLNYIRSHAICEILNFWNFKLCEVFFVFVMKLNWLSNIWTRILAILNF